MSSILTYNFTNCHYNCRMGSVNDMVGHRLKQAREDAGLTQQELCEILDISRTSITQYENGKYAIPLEILLKFPNILNRPIAYFLGLDFKTLADLSPETQEIIRLLEPLESKYKEAILGYVRFTAEEAKKEANKKAKK